MLNEPRRTTIEDLKREPIGEYSGRNWTLERWYAARRMALGSTHNEAWKRYRIAEGRDRCIEREQVQAVCPPMACYLRRAA